MRPSLITNPTPKSQSTTTTTTTTATETTTTAPCVPYQEDTVAVGYQWIFNSLPNVASIKRVPCGNCVSFEPCNDKDVHDGLCYIRGKCESDPNDPKCLVVADCVGLNFAAHTHRHTCTQLQIIMIV